MYCAYEQDPILSFGSLKQSPKTFPLLVVAHYKWTIVTMASHISIISSSNGCRMTENSGLCSNKDCWLLLMYCVRSLNRALYEQCSLFIRKWSIEYHVPHSVWIWAHRRIRRCLPVSSTILRIRWPRTSELMCSGCLLRGVVSIVWVSFLGDDLRRVMIVRGCWVVVWTMCGRCAYEVKVSFGPLVDSVTNMLFTCRGSRCGLYRINCV